MYMSFKCLSDRYFSLEEGDIITLKVLRWGKGRTQGRTVTQYPICERNYDGMLQEWHCFPEHFEPLEIVNG